MIDESLERKDVRLSEIDRSRKSDDLHKYFEYNF